MGIKPKSANTNPKTEEDTPEYDRSSKPRKSRTKGKIIFVGNFDEDVTKEDLFALCSPFGKIDKAQIWIDFCTGKSRGFGFVQFADGSQADYAVCQLDGKKWRGRRIKVDWRKDRNGYYESAVTKLTALK